MVSDTTRILLADGHYVNAGNMPKQCRVVSYDGRSFLPMDATLIDQGVQQVIEIETRMGRSVTIGQSHLCLTDDGWRDVGDLRVGDAIAVPTTLPFFGDTDAPDHLSGLMGLWIAEGSGRTSSPRITTTLYGSKVEEWAREYGCVARNIERRDGKAETYQITHGSRGGNRVENPVRAVLRLYGLDTCVSADKHIPGEVFGFSRRAAAHFLQWLFNGDGWLCRRSQTDRRYYSFELGFVSKSRQLVYDVSHLLLRFGIVGRVRTRDNHWIWTTRRYEEVHRFVTYIGIDRPDAGLVAEHHSHKRKRMFGVIEYDPIIKTATNENQQTFGLNIPSTAGFVANDILVCSQEPDGR